MDELALLAGSQRVPSGRTTRISAFGMALPIESGGGRPRRVEVGGAERLGEAVHQVRLRLREELAQRVERRARHPAAGVGEVAQLRGRLRRPGRSASWSHSGGTQVRPVTPCCAQSRDDVARQEVVHEDDVGADVKAVVTWLSPASKLSGSAARMTSSAVFPR